jgi:hypothetical protein
MMKIEWRMNEVWTKLDEGDTQANK